MAMIKYGVHGPTMKKATSILGTVVVCGGPFDNMEGEIISKRDGRLSYLTVQVPSEFTGRAYILNLSHTQYRNATWRILG